MPPKGRRGLEDEEFELILQDEELKEFWKKKGKEGLHYSNAQNTREAERDIEKLQDQKDFLRIAGRLELIKATKMQAKSLVKNMIHMWAKNKEGVKIHRNSLKFIAIHRIFSMTITVVWWHIGTEKLDSSNQSWHIKDHKKIAIIYDWIFEIITMNFELLWQ